MGAVHRTGIIVELRSDRVEEVEGVGVKVIGYERIIKGGGEVDGGRGCGSV